jgi:hypothetical protein
VTLKTIVSHLFIATRDKIVYTQFLIFWIDVKKLMMMEFITIYWFALLTSYFYCFVTNTSGVYCVLQLLTIELVTILYESYFCSCWQTLMVFLYFRCREKFWDSSNEVFTTPLRNSCLTPWRLPRDYVTAIASSEAKGKYASRRLTFRPKFLCS